VFTAGRCVVQPDGACRRAGSPPWPHPDLHRQVPAGARPPSEIPVRTPLALKRPSNRGRADRAGHARRSDLSSQVRDRVHPSEYLSRPISPSFCGPPFADCAAEVETGRLNAYGILAQFINSMKT